MCSFNYLSVQLGFICACIPIKAEQRPVSAHKIGRPRESKTCKCKGDDNSTGSRGRVFSVEMLLLLWMASIKFKILLLMTA